VVLVRTGLELFCPVGRSGGCGGKSYIYQSCMGKIWEGSSPVRVFSTSAPIQDPSMGLYSSTSFYLFSTRTRAGETRVNHLSLVVPPLMSWTAYNVPDDHHASNILYNAAPC